MKREENGNYELGYGKPPQHARFQKGHSGNPKGRPRGSKNTATLVMEALREPVIISENGRRKKITKHQAIIKQLVTKAAAGDPRSIQFLLTYQIPAIEARREAAHDARVSIRDLLALALPRDKTTREGNGLASAGKVIGQLPHAKPDTPAP